MLHPPSEQWAAQAATACTKIGTDTYKIALASTTVPDALCALDHDERGIRCHSYCIRHHPHDNAIEFRMPLPTLHEVVRHARAKLSGCKYIPGDAMRCTVRLARIREL